MRPATRIAAAAICLASLPALVGGCASTTAAGEAGGGRKQLLLVSSEQMNEASTQAYAKLRAEAAAKGELDRDPALVQRIKGIVSRLVPQTAVFRPDALKWNWQVSVIDNDEINAFCMPGGKIGVYSGMIRQLHPSDAEIAVVLGHEISHALREHSREQMSQELAAKAAIGIGSAVLGLGQFSSSLADAGYKALLQTRFSRTDEDEADRMGLELAARAGYDPHAGVTIWQKMMQADRGDHPPALLSTHPTDESRIKTMESLVPKLMPLYRAAQR
ncbi:MAG TPA: M48 family metallopeptidase [Rhodocyclaceae bacterium]